MTDDGLGGGNHFLSLEEGDDDNMYIICHTGSRNLGIALYQTFLKMIDDFNYDEGLNDSFLPKEKLTPQLIERYNSVLSFASLRRKDFAIQTLLFLQRNGYVKSDNSFDINNATKGLFYDEGKLNGVQYKMQDSIHNHIRFDKDIVHRKGSTELIKGEEVTIPLSMTRGSLIVRPGFDDYTLKLANYSCSHGAGRQLSRSDTLKRWYNLKESEKNEYRKNFSELLDRSGDFPRGYIQEFDFAYKPSEDILKNQPYLIKVATTTPVATVKFTEI
jgi:tRNA-splicing ligase RtcB/release factor H-coupled RctB family protein